MPKGPMSEETKRKIAKTWAEKKQKQANEQLAEVLAPPEAPVNTARLSHKPTVAPQGPPTYGIASDQPALTKEECIEFAFGIPAETQRLPDFKEPQYGGLPWKAHHEDATERGWCVVKMSDGSYNIVEHR